MYWRIKDGDVHWNKDMDKDKDTDTDKNKVGDKE
jgi:hypothetical protein